MPKKNKGFVGSRSQGRVGENLVVRTLEEVGVYCEIVSGKNSDYDIACNYNDKIFFIEVKNDIKARFTNNVAIELYNTKTGQMSGLSVTKADIWAHIIGEDVYFIKVLNLMGIVMEIQPIKIVLGGDNNSFMYLYEKSILNNPLFFLHNKNEPNKTLEFILGNLG